jgi:hypothetical protein
MAIASKFKKFLIGLEFTCLCLTTSPVIVTVNALLINRVQFSKIYSERFHLTFLASLTGFRSVTNLTV